MVKVVLSGIVVEPKERSALSVLTEVTVKEPPAGSEEPFHNVYIVPFPPKSLKIPSLRV